MLASEEMKRWSGAFLFEDNPRGALEALMRRLAAQGREVIACQVSGAELIYMPGFRENPRWAVTLYRVWAGRRPKAMRARCGARTRKGTPCQARVVAGKKRCRLHGGCSTGPKSEAGRNAIAESNRRRAERART
jgi:hypothetical protein